MKWHGNYRLAAAAIAITTTASINGANVSMYVVSTASWHDKKGADTSERDQVVASPMPVPKV